MRALVLALVALCAVTAHAERAGFDHARHELALDKQGTTAIACTKCHAFRAGELVGKPDHASCFGACHGPAPAGKAVAIAEAQRAVCVACHAAAALAAGTFATGFPPYGIAPDFAADVDHAVHAQVACTECHATPDAPRKGPPHRRCAACHDGKPSKPFAMTDCRGCHPRADASAPLRAQLAQTEAAQLSVASAFSHARHAGRGAAGKACGTCHPGVATTRERALPRPPMASCGAAGCHDGKAAFATTVACTKCHREAPAQIFVVARPSTRFSHALPAHAGANLACLACHPVSASNEVQVSGHGPCVACHEADFAARRPKICGACHIGTEPWRPLVADQRPAERSEFGATLDHSRDAHAARACDSCHSLTTPTKQLRPPRGHDACTNRGCHARSGGAAPLLTACEQCHELGLADRRDATRRAVAWSVRARFDHAPHAIRPGTTPPQPLPCATCHVDMTATRVLDLAAPPKATCAGCHDGTTAFKLTGTGCTRCHPGPTK